MKNVVININSFKLGMQTTLAEELKLQLDIAYADNLVNFIPRNNGWLTRRPGSIYLDSFKDLQKDACQMFTIECNHNTYLLIFTENRLRIYINNQLVLGANNSGWFKTPYDAKVLQDKLTYTTSNISNSILLFSPKRPPQRLTLPANKDDNITLAPLEFEDGPYEDINTNDILLQIESTSGNGILLNSSVDCFSDSDLGIYLRAYDENTKIWGVCIVRELVNTKLVKVDIVKNFGSTNKTKFWRKAVFGDHKGWPQMGVVFNSRLYIACNYTNRIWVSNYDKLINFSPTGNLVDFNIGTNLPDTINYNSSITFAINEISNILWITTTLKYVIIGTPEGIFGLMPLDFSKSLSPYNFIVQKISDNYSSLVSKSNNFIFYTNGLNNINVLEYLEDIINPIRVNNIINTLPYSPNINRLSYCDTYENILAIGFSNYDLAFITINNIGKQIYFAFSKVQLGGGGKVLDLAGNDKFLYLIVNRNINNKNIYTVEYLNWQDLNTSLIEDATLNDIRYLDCTKTFNDQSGRVEVYQNTNTAVIVDSYYLGEFCVNDKTIPINVPNTLIYTGFNFTSNYSSINLKNILNSTYNTNYIKIKDISLSVVNSLYGSVSLGLHNIEAPIVNNLLNDISTKFFTGVVNLPINIICGNKVIITCSQSTPLPFTLSLISTQFLING